MSENLVLVPPTEYNYFCPTCKGALLEVHIFAESDHGHVQPCGDAITPDELRAVIHGDTREEHNDA